MLTHTTTKSKLLSLGTCYDDKNSLTILSVWITSYRDCSTIIPASQTNNKSHLNLNDLNSYLFISKALPMRFLKISKFVSCGSTENLRLAPVEFPIEDVDVVIGSDELFIISPSSSSPLLLTCWCCKKIL